MLGVGLRRHACKGTRRAHSVVMNGFHGRVWLLFFRKRSYIGE